MEKAATSDAVKAHRKQKKDKTTDMRALILGSKARSVEVKKYPTETITFFVGQECKK